MAKAQIDSEPDSHERPTPTPMGEVLKQFQFKPVSPDRQAEIDRALAEHERREKQMQIDHAVGSLIADVGRHASATLENFEVYHQRQQQVIDCLKQLDEKLPSMIKAGQGLVFYGPAGGGKDHLAVATAIRVCRTHLIHGRQLDARQLGIATWETAAKLVDFMASPPLLIVSDPSGNTIENERLMALIDARYKRQRSTWFTVNAKSIEPVPGQDPPTDMKSLLGPAIVGRLLQDAEVFSCIWPDYRMRKTGKNRADR